MKKTIGLFLLLLMAATRLTAQQAEYLVISEVRYYETSGINEEFVELYNPTNAAIELSGHKIQYKSSTGVNWTDKTTFTANDVIQAKGFYLYGGSATVPVPDVSSAATLGLGNSGGHVRLLNSSLVELDRVAWGAADSPEGTVLGSHERGGSFERKAFETSTAASMEAGGADETEGNGWDSDDNSSDFVIHNSLATANPQNGSSPIEPDVPLVDGSGTVSVSPSSITAPGPANLAFTFTAGDTLLTTVQIELPAGWNYQSAMISGAGFSQANFIENPNDVVVNAAALQGADTGILTLVGVTVPTTSGNFTVHARTATADGTLAVIQVQPVVQVIGDPIDISELHNNNGDGLPVLLGQVVVVRGVVTLANELGIAAYMEDATGGIVVYDATFADGVSIGDDVTVIGTLTQFNGLAELTPGTVIETHATGVEVEPTAVTCLQISNQGASGEPYEGRLVQLYGVTVAGTGTWAGNTNYVISDGTGSTELRIDSDCTLVGLPIPGDPFDLIGNVSQYDFSAPHTSGFQVLPRFASDVIQSGGPGISGGPWESGHTQSGLSISWTTTLPGASIVTWGLTEAHEIDSLVYENSTTQHSVDIADLDPATAYHVRVGAVDVSGSSMTSDFLVSTVSPSSSPGTMEVFFTKDVESEYALPGNEANGNHDMIGEIVNLIDGAETSLDCALYSLNINAVLDAIVDAHDRGVAVRFIYDSDHDQGEVAQIANAGVTVIDNSFGSNGAQGIQHNKFLIVDAADEDPSNDRVWMGGMNFIDTPSNGIYAKDNAILIADQAIARTYTLEFNEMWGSDTMTPNAANSRFGEFKTNNTPHHFVVGGRQVEVWFSQGDFVSQQMRNLIATADHSLYFNILSFTLNDVNYAMRDRFEDAGVAVRGNFDDQGDQFSEWTDMLAWGADIHTDAGPGILHSKYLIVDAEHADSDPAVWTGSFNWSSAADNINDENVVVVHDELIANQYLQEFANVYHDAGGTADFVVGIEERPGRPVGLSITDVYPNPFNPRTTLDFQLERSDMLSVEICNLLGQRVSQIDLGLTPAGTHQLPLDLSAQASGMYLVRLSGERQGSAVRKVMLVK
ncbi:MAG: lamin tail domain-containing protein [Calditrichaeota bacterium]|nr:lamin tail domain-containing protein [Calditrichota bacterium]MCB9474287.1 lamin tail domain-containing protein [Candidatus Delongbacteria bacterium]